MLLLPGLGDFFGFGDGEECALDLSRIHLLAAFFFVIDLRAKETCDDCAEASAVASQMRKRTTATERNRARDAINAYRIVKKLKGYELKADSRSAS